jgi:uncharacterized membrane protein
VGEACAGHRQIIGFLIALQAYIRNTSIPRAFTAQWGVLHRFLYNKWFFDELYDVIFVRPPGARPDLLEARRRAGHRPLRSERRRGAGRGRQRA